MFYHIICPSIPLCTYNCCLFSFHYYVTSFVFYQKTECESIYYHFRHDHESSSFQKLARNKWIFQKIFMISFWESFQGCWLVIKSEGGKTVFLKSSNMLFLLKLNYLPKCVPVCLFLCVYVEGGVGSRVMRQAWFPWIVDGPLVSKTIIVRFEFFILLKKEGLNKKAYEDVF